MAELVLGVAGVVLAWKGILDFGDLVLRLADDDGRRREGLAVRLEVSQYKLKDWGDHWGVDRDDGKFHKFEPARKALIMKIIFRLHDSRVKALTVLHNRYEPSPSRNDDKIDDARDNDGKRLLKMVSRLKDASRRIKNKSTWHLHDQVQLNELVAETMDLHESLQYLTYGSMKFVRDTSSVIEVVSSLHAGLQRMERQLDSISQSHATPFLSTRSRLEMPQSPASDTLLPMMANSALDDTTLASYASRSIVSSIQVGLIQSLIDRSFDFHGDARIPEAIVPWWRRTNSDTMLMEASELDDSIDLACASMYYIVQCPKLVYTFQSRAACEVQPTSQLAEMLRTLILSTAEIMSKNGLDDFELPADITNSTAPPADLDTLWGLLPSFLRSMHALVTRTIPRVFITISGLEVIEADRDIGLTRILHSLVEGLLEVCVACNENKDTTTLKVLLASKSHATAFYNLLDDSDILDITDYSSRTINVMQEIKGMLY